MSFHYDTSRKIDKRFKIQLTVQKMTIEPILRKYQGTLLNPVLHFVLNQ